MSQQAEMFVPNPERYRRLSAPFASVEAAQEALQAFYAAVSAIREEAKIPDVLVAILYSVVVDGEEQQQAAEFFFGDERNAEMLAALALGKERANRERRVSALIGEVPPKVGTFSPAQEPEG